MSNLATLARHLHEAPECATHGRLNRVKLDIGWSVNPSSTTEDHILFYAPISDIKAKRDELSGKPKEWVNDWARWRVQQIDGFWFEYEKEPEAHVTADYWVSLPGSKSTPGSVGKGEVLGDWRDTLEERVVEDMKQQFTVTPDGNMTYQGDKPIHVGVGVIFNPGDTLVRVDVEEKSELCGANKSLVNLDKSPDWIEWEGGVRPVDGDVEVVAKLRNGDEMIRKSYDLSWAHCPNGDLDSSQEIIAYRPNYPGFLVNPMNDGGITDHELDEPVDDKKTAIQELNEIMMGWDGEYPPPIGTVCYIKIESTGEVKSATIVFIGCSHTLAWLFREDREASFANNMIEIFPLKSDKDVQIEKMVNIINDNLTAGGIAEALDKANYRIQENDDE